MDYYKFQIRSKDYDQTLELLSSMPVIIQWETKSKTGGGDFLFHFKKPVSDKLLERLIEIFSNKGIKGHIWRMHGAGQSHDANRGYAEGTRLSCTKGLTKETSASVKRMAEALKGRPGRSGWHHTKETKLLLSKKLSINNKGGRCKWYTVQGQRVQGTWERNVATHMTVLGIQWRKLAGKNDTIAYTTNEGRRSYYLPDFLLPSHELLLEIKGHWWGTDLQKMQSVFISNPELRQRLFIAEENKYTKLLQSKTTKDFITILQDASLDKECPKMYV